MNIVQKVLGAISPSLTTKSAQLSLTDPQGWIPEHRRTSAGELVSLDRVLGLTTAWACVNLLAGTIGSLPLMVYRTIDGVRRVDTAHSLYRILHSSPNFDQTAVDFWEFTVANIELQGDGYAEIDRRGNGNLVSLTPIPANIVNKRRLDGGDIEYRWINADGKQRVEPQERILHIRGPFGGPMGGASTLSVCRDSFGAAIATDRAASSMFANGVRPSGVLMKEEPLTKPQREEVEKLLQEKFVGAANSGRPMLLDNNLKWHQLSLNPEDAQMLESRRFSVEEICRIFGIPPHMVGHTENSTSWGTGLEQQTLGFQKFTLRRRLKRIEQALEKQLLTPADRAGGVTIEFNLEGLLRGDSTARAAFYKSGLGDGWMTINEVRRLENAPPIEGGDVARVQMQNVPLAIADQQIERIEGGVNAE